MKTCEHFDCHLPPVGFFAAGLGASKAEWSGHCLGHLQCRISDAIEARTPFSVAPFAFIAGTAAA